MKFITQEEINRLSELEQRYHSKEESENLTDEELQEFEGLQAKKSQQDFVDEIDRVVDDRISSLEKTQIDSPKMVAVQDDEMSPYSAKPNWAKRSAMYFNAAVAYGREDYEGYRRHLNKLKGEEEKVNERVLKAEEAYAKQVIQNANISRIGQIRAMDTLTGVDGGFLLPKPFLAEVFVILEQRGLARRVFRGVPMGSKDLDLKDVATKPIVSWVDEEADIPDSDASFGEQKLNTKKLAALSSWTSEFGEDEVFGIMNIMTELFAESLRDKEDEAGLAGDGTASTGGFTGLLNLAGAETFTLATGKTSFADAEATDYRNAIDQLSLARRVNARWFIHPDVASQIEQLQDSQGQFVFRRPGDLNRPATFWGYPIEVSENLPGDADDAASTKFAVFGDPNKMLFGTRSGVSVTTSMEGAITSGDLVVFNALTNDGTIIKITERIGFKAPIENAYVVMVTSAT